MLQQLDHKNIVKFYGWNVDKHFYKIYFEFVDLGNIRNLIKQFGPLNEMIVRHYLVQLIEALEFIHYKKIAH